MYILFTRSDVTDTNEDERSPFDPNENKNVNVMRENLNSTTQKEKSLVAVGSWRLSSERVVVKI